MLRFSQIIGQEHIKEHLQGALASGMINHAYILQGDEGFGKSTIAETFAMGLMCEQSDVEPCMTCHACKQAMSRNHPDIIYLVPEKPGVIKVDEIRRQIINDICIKPYSAPYKVYIIPNAEEMNTQAQNALLKTLEEPPAYAVILLLSRNANMLLDTIRSRCVLLNLKPLKDEQVQAYLTQHLELPEYQAKICSAFARGSIGRALSLQKDEDFEKLREKTTDVLKNIKRMSISAISMESRALADQKFDQNGFLEYLYLWYRDVLLCKTNKGFDGLLFLGDRNMIAARAEDSTYEGIRTILEMIGKTKDRLASNVNKEMTMELLLWALKEN
ncbi:MAG: DNA polymerase III subunit delta' [Lachnospiraceae bacterium]|nr:DNA polymerase III subunit delta' [Lachnospiraceae bacterium]